MQSSLYNHKNYSILPFQVDFLQYDLCSPCWWKPLDTSCTAIWFTITTFYVMSPNRYYMLVTRNFWSMTRCATLESVVWKSWSNGFYQEKNLMKSMLHMYLIRLYTKMYCKHGTILVFIREFQGSRMAMTVVFLCA